MLFGITFTAKPGKENELEKVLSDKDVIHRVTEHMGATLEAVFLSGSRFVEVFDLPDRQAAIARDKILRAHAQPEVKAFLERLAPLLDDPFHPEDPTSFAAWLQRHKMRLVFDARIGAREAEVPPTALPAPAAAPAPRVPAAGPPKASFERVVMGAAPR